MAWATTCRMCSLFKLMQYFTYASPARQSRLCPREPMVVCHNSTLGRSIRGGRYVFSICLMKQRRTWLWRQRMPSTRGLENDRLRHLYSYVLSCRMQKLSWVCLALMLALCMMPSTVGGLPSLDGQGLGLEEATVGELPALGASVVQCTSGPDTSLLRSLHLPDLSFHPPA